MPQQLALGEFVFGLATDFPYERLARKATGGWVDLDIISSKPLSHNTGQGLEALRLSGKAQWAEGMARVSELRAMLNARVPYTLVDGWGRNWGRWRIDSVNEDQERVIADGTATLLAWTLELSEFVNA
ncbi:phage tail protein [Pseudomonas aeruginosa]|uniref:phage tail protein n=1 Tax=Pseudomonas aeruginosa TaxID=287 RepID=UPI000E31FF57|nr:phage tail protein [Pseudomonas aeruginosa]NPZ19500.1 phage tail protein [Pseudomonas aeruginosa]